MNQKTEKKIYMIISIWLSDARCLSDLQKLLNNGWEIMKEYSISEDSTNRMVFFLEKEIKNETKN